MAGSEERNHQYLFSSASLLNIHSKNRSYREVRLILKARLVKTVVDDLCNSAYLAEKDPIRGTDSAMGHDNPYVWSGFGISSSRGVFPFTNHLVAPSNMFWAFVVQKTSVAGPAVEAKLGRPGVFGMRDTILISVSCLLMSWSG